MRWFWAKVNEIKLSLFVVDRSLFFFYLCIHRVDPTGKEINPRVKYANPIGWWAKRWTQQFDNTRTAQCHGRGPVWNIWWKINGEKWSNDTMKRARASHNTGTAGIRCRGKEKSWKLVEQQKSSTAMPGSRLASEHAVSSSRPSTPKSLPRSLPPSPHSTSRGARATFPFSPPTPLLFGPASEPILWGC